jgi:hypothetical protein
VRAALVAAAAALCLVAAGCGGGKTSATATTTITTVGTVTNPTGNSSVKTHGRFHYPAVLVTNFMRSCTRGGQVKEAYCACTLDKHSNSVSTQDFARIGLSGGKVPTRIRRLIRRATIACADKL